ncbi:MAG: restriction endonuclease subunit S [Lysobacteraceae bacterium]
MSPSAKSWRRSAMAFEWPSVPLSEIAKLRSGFPFKSASWIDYGVPVIKIGNVKDGRIVKDGCGFVSEKVAATVPEWITKDGDILIAMTGYVGEVAVVQAGERYLINQRVGRFDFLNDSPVFPRFLFYYLRLPETRAYVEDLARGSAQPNLSASDAARLMVPAPPIEEQHAIAETLGALDDRIDNLRQTNATLEAIAAALFKSWFVDFDGVAEADMQESELGLIPKGWWVADLADCVDFKEGPGIRNWQYTNTDEGIRFINIRCIQDGDLHLETANRITEEEANGKYAHFHLQPWDIVVSTSGTLGRSAIVRAEHLPLVLNTSVIRFRPIEGKTAFSYLYQYLNGSEFLEKLESMASGSVQKNFGPMHLKQIKIALPPIEMVRSYEDVARPIYEQIIGNRSQSRTLAQLRDTLLPKLLSGELRVKETQGGNHD